MHLRLILAAIALISLPIAAGEEDSPEPYSPAVDCTKCSGSVEVRGVGALRDQLPSEMDASEFEIDAGTHSHAPTNLPVKKIWIHGRPIYVRQVFVEPIRPTVDDRLRHKRSELANNTDEGRRMKRTGFPIAGGGGDGGASAYPPVARPLYYAPTYSLQQSQPAQVLYPQQTQPAVQQFSYPQLQQPAPSQQPESPVNIYVQSFEQFQQQPPQQTPLQLPLQPQQQPLLLSAPNPLPQLVVPSAIRVEQPALPTVSYPPPQAYPLPECYTDDSGFMCCNSDLEATMKRAYQDLVSSNPNFNRCDGQKIANKMQKCAQERFKGHTFEVVVGFSDYASQSQFSDNLICKIERDQRYILAYATPQPEPTPPPPPSPAPPLAQYPQYPRQQDETTTTKGSTKRASRNHSYEWRARK